MKTFLFELISSEKIIYSGLISEVLIPTKLGLVGIRSGHADMVCQTVAGKIVVNNNEKEFEVGEGFLEVTLAKTTVLILL